MDDAQDNNQVELKFTIRNHFRDIYIGYLLLSCMPPFLWINLAFFIFNGYRSAFPLFQSKEYMLGAFALAYDVLLVAVIFSVFMLVLISIMFFTKKLKSVIGEHAYTFGADGFIEKTAYNENNVSYGIVNRFLEARRHYLLVMPSMNVYMLPKRDLPVETQGDLKRRFRNIKPLKRLFAPYAVLVVVIASAISLFFALSMTKYAVITHAVPFRAVWNEHTLYITGGKIKSGQVLRYKDILGIGSPSLSFSLPPMVAEQYLWVVRDGKVDPYLVQAGKDPVNICLYDGRLYAFQFDIPNRRKMVYFLTPNAFVEEQATKPEEVMKACSPEREKKEGPLTAINLYEWDEKVGKGKTLEIPLGSGTFVLGMNHSEAVPGTDTGLFGESELQTMSLSGGWAAGPARKPEKLYSATSGFKSVNKETYEQYFGKLFKEGK